MKKHIIQTIIISILSMSLVSCEDWLTEQTPGVTELEDYFINNPIGAEKVVTAAYVPMTWQFVKTFCSEWYIGDIVSDDALKGGANISDMTAAYDMENFKTAPNNELLRDFYRAQYQGIGRCNLALQEISKMETDSILTTKFKNRLLGEAKFLRAMYYFRLVRVFGGIPKVDFVVESSNKWKQPRASTEEIYNLITSDLTFANDNLWKKSEYASKDLGRATKGAAQAMLLKTYLYNKEYALAKSWGDSIINSGEYYLVNDYASIFTLSGENGGESVFEIQYMDEPTSDWGINDYFKGTATRGNFTVLETRTRNSIAKGGYGFNKPTQNLYDEYETADPRRDATIINPADSLIANPAEEIYLGNRYLNKKYAMMNPDGSYIKLSHESRAPLNLQVIRYADVLLMYAEACCETNNLDRAKWALEEVRARARNNSADPLTVLPEFPYGTYADNQTDLRKAIRHERRVELAMEGHRWFDLVRWGIAKETMDAYKLTETPQAQSHMSNYVVGKHELFPIPAEEIDLNPVEQNPGY